jgi:hypothetical protein
MATTAPSGHRASAATWHAAEMSHLRILGRGNALPAGDVQIRWACYLVRHSIETYTDALTDGSSCLQLMNSLQALLNGQNPPFVPHLASRLPCFR